MKKELIGRKLYHKENKVGKITDVLKDPFNGKHKVAVVKTGMNNYKAAPMLYIEPVEDRCIFLRDEALLDNFPKMSMKNFEDTKEFQENLTQHYGKPENWSLQEKIDSDKDDSYMGSSQVSNEAPDDNTSLKDKMDYDDLKHHPDSKTK